MTRQQAIEDQALDWLVRRDGSDWTAHEQAEFDAWLVESMAHKAAFWRAEQGWRQADRIRSLGLDSDNRASLSRPKRAVWRTVALAASLAVVVAAGGLGLVMRMGQPAVQVEQLRFDTPIGGHKVVPLADGSKVELNTQTVLRTAIGPPRREIWLDSGEAFFEVAHDEDRPFVVHAGRRTITVLGTKFSVRRDGGGVTVNVLEGRVRIDDDQGTQGRAAIITAGDTAISRGASTLIAGKSDVRVANALAWRDGMLSFDQAPLTEVVAEFNRYNHSRLIVTDPAAGRILIGGSFQSSSVDSFVRLLHDAYGLRIDREDAQVKISSP